MNKRILKIILAALVIGAALYYGLVFLFVQGIK